jgi:hypothetical protein
VSRRPPGACVRERARERDRIEERESRGEERDTTGSGGGWESGESRRAHG